MAVLAGAACSKSTSSKQAAPTLPTTTTEAPTTTIAATTSLSVSGTSPIPLQPPFYPQVTVTSVENGQRELKLNEFILLPFITNAVEQIGAINSAFENRMEETMAIAAGSGVQVALLVAGLLCLLSVLFGHPITLIFMPRLSLGLR